MSSFGFTTIEATPEFGENPEMAKERPYNLDLVEDRLRITRKALGLSQADLCRRTGIGTQAWNNMERGRDRIGLDSALLLCRTTGVSLDWIYLGYMGTLPQKIAVEIEAIFKKGARRA